MSKRVGISAISVLLWLSARVLYAGAGSDGAAFLKIDPGARPGGMGGAYTAVAEDAISIFYNPAGPALADRDQAALSHAEWVQGLRNEHAAYVHPLTEKLAVFGGFAALLSSRLDEYDDAGLRTGSFSAMDGAAGLGAAWKSGENLSLGVFAKGIYQQAAGEKGSAFAGDAGALYTYGDDMRFGAAAQNLGTGIRLYHERFALPRTFRAGAAYRLADLAWFSADLIKAGGSDAAVALGAEGEYGVTAGERIFLRFGYKSGRQGASGSGVSAGLGIRSGDLGMDYSFSPYGDLGDAHRFTLTFRFGESSAQPAPRKAPAARKAPAKKKSVNGNGGAKRPPKQSKNDDPVYFIW